MRLGALNYKLFLTTAVFSASLAFAGRGQAPQVGTGPDEIAGPQADGSFDYAPNKSPAKFLGIPALADDDAKVKVRVKVQLAGEGEIGHVKVQQKQADGSFKTLITCKSSNSFHDVPPGPNVSQPAFRTPEGRYQPLDLSKELLYPPLNGWDSGFGPATYYMAIESKANPARRSFAALHNKHTDGANSHGCVRMEQACADAAAKAANDTVKELAADDQGNVPNSVVFGDVEQRLWSDLRPSGGRRARRDFSAVVIDLRWDWNGEF